MEIQTVVFCIVTPYSLVGGGGPLRPTEVWRDSLHGIFI
jgi:hypothetical protein